VAYIGGLMKIEISKLHADPANVRKHSDKNIKAIEASLARFGQQKPIVVDKNNVVRAGNGTLQAAINLGWDKIWISKSKLSPSELTAYAIADNRTAELAEWDMEALGLQLAELEVDLSDIGFDEIDMTALGFDDENKSTKTDPESEWEGMPEFNQQDAGPIKKLVINFKTEEDLNDFANLVKQSITMKTKSIWHPEEPKDSAIDKVYET